MDATAFAPEGYDLPDEYQFSAALRVGELVFFSGMIGADLSTFEIPERFEDEVRLLFKNLDRVLRSAGTDLHRLVQVESLHIPLDQEHLDVFRQVRADYIAAPYPTWIPYGVTALGLQNARVEVKGIARL